MGLGPAEIAVLVILAVVLFGPEKLPELARKAARVIRYVRTIANDASGQIRKELGPEYADFDFRDLNPRAFVAKHLLSEVEPVVADVKRDLGEINTTVEQSRRDITDALDGDDGGPSSNGTTAAAVAITAAHDDPEVRTAAGTTVLGRTDAEEPGRTSGRNGSADAGFARQSTPQESLTRQGAGAVPYDIEAT